MTGEELRQLRQRLGWTQRKLAGALGLTVTYVGMMERAVKAIERRTELAVLYLVAEEDRLALYERDEPLSETANLAQAIETAKEAVHFFRTSGERLSRIAEPTVHVSVLTLAEELTKLLLESEQSPSLELSHAS